MSLPSTHAADTDRITNSPDVDSICKRLEDLREESFEAKTYRQELKQWWWGLSGRITVCNDELKELRAEISVRFCIDLPASTFC